MVKLNHGSSSKKLNNPLTKLDSRSPENMSITFVFYFKLEAELWKSHNAEDISAGTRVHCCCVYESVQIILVLIALA